MRDSMMQKGCGQKEGVGTGQSHFEVDLVTVGQASFEYFSSARTELVRRLVKCVSGD